MNRILVGLLLMCFSNLLHAEDFPDQHAEGIKKVHGVVSGIEHIDSSRRGSASTGIPIVDLVEAIYGSNYLGFPIYTVKITSNISLEVASKESFAVGDCVLVWYDGAMGDSPNLSMLGQAGMANSSGCTP